MQRQEYFILGNDMLEFIYENANTVIIYFFLIM